MLDTNMHKTKKLLFVFLRWIHSLISFSVWSNCISESCATGPPRKVSTLPICFGQKTNESAHDVAWTAGSIFSNISQLKTKSNNKTLWNTTIAFLSCISLYRLLSQELPDFFWSFCGWPELCFVFFLTFFHHRKTQFLQLGTWSAEVWSKLPKPMRPMALNVRIAQNVVILDTSWHFLTLLDTSWHFLTGWRFWHILMLTGEWLTCCKGMLETRAKQTLMRLNQRIWYDSSQIFALTVFSKWFLCVFWCVKATRMTRRSALLCDCPAVSCTNQEIQDPLAWQHVIKTCWHLLAFWTGGCKWFSMFLDVSPHSDSGCPEKSSRPAKHSKIGRNYPSNILVKN